MLLKRSKNQIGIKKSPIRETPNLQTDADSSTIIFVSAGVEKWAFLSPSPPPEAGYENQKK